MRHLISFTRSPLGYILNLAASVAAHAERLPGVGRVFVVLGGWLAAPCETLCARDGVQDDMLF